MHLIPSKTRPSSHKNDWVAVRVVSEQAWNWKVETQLKYNCSAPYETFYLNNVDNMICFRRREKGISCGVRSRNICS